MFIPNGFLPSFLAARPNYDEESRLVMDSDEAIGGANDIYKTDAQDKIAGFLAKNKAQDLKTKDYEIQVGGACVYKNKKGVNGKQSYSAPDPQNFFGHDSIPGKELQGTMGRKLNLGDK